MSQYLFTGSLQAYIRGTCSDRIPNARVLLYRHRDDQNVEEQVAARSKHTFTVLSEDAVREKESSLIASATTNEDGAFRFDLGSEQQYGGEPFEVDVRLTTFKGADPDKKQEPVQFTVTSLQPEWQQTDEGAFEVPPWNYSIPARYWCYLLMRRRLWVVCGRVFATGSTVPLSGMKVRAYDRDWIQDDLLGEDVTDGAGWFFIYYTTGTFKQTPFSPFINVEMTSGPDLYFEIEDSGGNKVLDENPSEGRQPGRENVGPCFCVNLEVGETPPYYKAYFTHVGNFHILFDINSVTGKILASKDGAGGTGWGFFHHTKLKGFCPKVHPVTSQPMYYRFLYVDPVTSVEKPVTGNLLRSVLVGSKLIQWDVNNTGSNDWTTQSIRVAGSGATPALPPGIGPVPDHVIVPDADGWIAVDQQALDGGFYGPLLRLRTEKIVPGGSAPAAPGAGSAPADAKNGALVEIIFETTTDKLTFERQTWTATLLVNNWIEVRALDLLQFQTGGAGSCTGLSTTLDILYTVDHELIDTWEVRMKSAASASGWTEPAGLPQGSTPRGGFGSHGPMNIAAWPPCSYQVWLYSRRALTDGEYNDDRDFALKTFCKV